MPHKLREMKAASSSLSYPTKNRSNSFHPPLQKGKIVKRILIPTESPISPQMMIKLFTFYLRNIQMIQPFPCLLHCQPPPAWGCGIKSNSTNVPFLENQEHFTIFYKCFTKACTILTVTTYTCSA